MSKNKGLQFTLSGELLSSLDHSAEKEFAGDVCAALKHAIATLKFLSDQESIGNKVHLYDPATNETRQLLFTPDDFSRWEDEL